MRDRYASLREGLVGAWIPSVSGSGLLLPDLSGQGNNGTLTNMGPEDWVSSQYGRALDFDGSNDYAAFSRNPINKYPYSVSCFVKLDTLTPSTDGHCIAAKKPSVLNWARLGFAKTPQYFFYEIFDGSTPATVSYSSVSANQWYHVAVVVRSSTMAMHVDGAEVSSTSHAIAEAIIAGLTSLNLGYLLNFGLYLNGQLDDIRIYNRALSESEIKLLASRPGIGLKPQRRTMYYAPPTGARRRRILTSMP